MKEPTARHRGIREFIFTSCAHGESSTVRGVISSSRFSSGRITPVGAGCIPAEAAHLGKNTSCVCGIPSYLVDLDERLEGHFPASPIVRRSNSNEAQQVETYDIVKIRSQLLPDLQL